MHSTLQMKNNNFIDFNKFIDTDAASIASAMFSHRHAPNSETQGLRKFQRFSLYNIVAGGILYLMCVQFAT